MIQRLQLLLNGRYLVQQVLRRKGGVRALTHTCAHHGVDLIDEEHDLPLGRLHLLQNCLQALLEFASEFCA